MPPIDKINISLEIQLDEIDTLILEIFKKQPNRIFQSHQIRMILEHNGIEIGYGELRNHLQTLSVLSILKKEKGQKTNKYRLFQP